MSQVRLETIYCIDSSSLIDLKLYPKDVFPNVWDLLENMAKQNTLVSHPEVYREVSVVDDDIKKWCRRHKRIFENKESSSIEIITNFKKVEKEYDKNYWANEITATKPWADPWIISLAICYKGIVVTDENGNKNKIPYVAGKFGLRSLNLLDFFRDMKAQGKLT